MLVRLALTVALLSSHVHSMLHCPPIAPELKPFNVPPSASANYSIHVMKARRYAPALIGLNVYEARIIGKPKLFWISITGKDGTDYGRNIVSSNCTFVPVPCTTGNFLTHSIEEPCNSPGFRFRAPDRRDFITFQTISVADVPQRFGPDVERAFVSARRLDARRVQDRFEIRLADSPPDPLGFDAIKSSPSLSSYQPPPPI